MKNLAAQYRRIETHQLGKGNDVEDTFGRADRDLSAILVGLIRIDFRRVGCQELGIMKQDDQAM